ncbi:MAG: bifunctional phosphoglucose/phosphomannose isomerase [Ignavibacteriales bacterium]|nr:bifunctional phosphoglucose/phosphomannose isomerase [Ignavibacteriales bacterium]
MTVEELVHKYDPQNQFKVLIDTYKQIDYAWNNPNDLGNIKKENISSIIVTGLGGSAMSGDLLQNFCAGEIKIPYSVNRNYFLPEYADEYSLVIVSSYSGNTEETISALNHALKKKCQVICISTGGKISQTAKKNNIPVVVIPAGLQPRYALGLSFFSLLKIFQTLNLIPDQSKYVEEIRELWKQNGEIFSTENNLAHSYAEKIIGYIPIIYSAADVTSAVGYRFKCQLNENSKLHAFHNVIPELNHNEIIGWESFDDDKFQAKLITVYDDCYLPQIKKRFEITSELAAKSGIEVINLSSNKNQFKVRLMDLIYLTDWITYYTAVLRAFDPTEINNINTLKERLA